MTSFVDTISLFLKAGDGGAGSTSFRREKFIPKGGPDGGNGGKGGSIILKASQKLSSFIDLKSKNKRKFIASNGSRGLGKKKFGNSGSDLIIEVPIGTLIFQNDNNLICDLSENNQEIIIAKGGKGGLGNCNFASSINQTPHYAQPGLPGEEVFITLELRMIAEIGLVGLPNAGKSSLLKCLTKANVKIANYPFTTLFPNLGTLKVENQEIIIADIPGIIKGASEGRGLGDDFLRHIDRTHSIIHLISANEDPDKVIMNYNETIKELQKSRYNLTLKSYINVISRSDIVSPDKIKEIIDQFNKLNIKVFSISSFTNDGISRLIKQILKISKKI